MAGDNKAHRFSLQNYESMSNKSDAADASADAGRRLNDCSMKHYIVLNIALFSHAHVTISAEINLTHACSRGEASRSNCHSRLRAFVGMASRNWETVLKV